MLKPLPPPADDPLKPSRDAAFLKLGRNIALFQQLEFRLKSLFTQLVVEGSSESDIAERSAKRSAILATRSLGLVARALFDELARADDEDGERSLPAGAAVHISTRMRFEGPHIDARRDAIAALVDERNQLVHHLTQQYDLHTADGIARLDRVLDPQAARIRSEIGEVDSLLDQIAEGRHALSEWMALPAFETAMMQVELVQSALVQGLARCGMSLCRADGWCVLQSALGRLQVEQPHAIADARVRYRITSMKAFLAGTGLFELRDEPTARGSRLLFRPLDGGFAQ